MTAEPLRYVAKGRIVRRDDMAAYEDGRSYLAAAQARAHELTLAAEQTFAARREEGFEIGRREGDIAAAAIVAETHRRAAEMLTGLEPRIESLVFEVLEQIVGSMDNRDLIVRLARQGLQRLRHHHRLRLLVAPENVAPVRAEIEAMLAREASATLLQVEADPGLGPSDCVMASELGYLRLSVDEQLAALRAALAQEGR